MIWFKSLLVGIAAAFVTAIVTAITLPVLMPRMMMWWADMGEGSGIAGFYFGTELVFLPVLIAFALGFWWSLRRSRRKRTVTSA